MRPCPSPFPSDGAWQRARDADGRRQAHISTSVRPGATRRTPRTLTRANLRRQRGRKPVMSLNRNLRWIAVAALVLVGAPSMLFAQPGAFGGGYGPALQVVPLPRSFASSDEHYKYLLAQAKGGTRHTIASVPRWDGLWVTAGNTHMSLFIDPPGFAGKVREGVLTPPYEKAYRERWRQQQELGEVQYQSSHPLRTGRLSALAARAVLSRVRQPAAGIVPDQRFRAGHPPRLHRPGAQERLRHALVVRRHDWVLGRSETRHAHEVSAAGRLHALVTDDE